MEDTHTYADRSALERAKATQSTTNSVDIDVPGLGGMCKFRKISVEYWHLVEQDMMNIASIANKMEVEQVRFNAKAEREGTEAVKLDDDYIFQNWKGDKLDFFCRLIIASCEKPRLDVEEDLPYLKTWDFDVILELGMKILNFIGGEASEDNLAKRQATFREATPVKDTVAVGPRDGDDSAGVDLPHDLG